MHITIPSQNRCAVDDCTNPGRWDVIRAHAGRWHLIDGYVYHQARGSLVCTSWACACDQHRESVAAAVQADVEEWRDRWSVHIRTLDYGDAEGNGDEEYAHGIGSDDGRLF